MWGTGGRRRCDRERVGRRVKEAQYTFVRINCVTQLRRDRDEQDSWRLCYPSCVSHEQQSQNTESGWVVCLKS